MIRLGMHTDNLRELSGSFAAGVELGAKNNLEHIECGFIDGVMFVQSMGYEPSVCSLENPRAIRRFVESVNGHMKIPIFGHEKPAHLAI